MLKEKLAAQFDFLKAKAPPLVGCDISSSSVKLVEIAEAGRNVYRVERYAIEPLPKDTVVDGNIANIEAAGEALKRAHKALGSRIRNIALALPAAAAGLGSIRGHYSHCSCANTLATKCFTGLGLVASI